VLFRGPVRGDIGICTIFLAAILVAVGRYLTSRYRGDPQVLRFYYPRSYHKRIRASGMNNRKRVCIVAAALFLPRYALAQSDIDFINLRDTQPAFPNANLFKPFSIVGMEEVWSTINKSNVSKTAVKIGVIDSSIDASGKRHPEFRNR
jgi:hypothetical protein